MKKYYQAVLLFMAVLLSGIAAHAEEMSIHEDELLVNPQLLLSDVLEKTYARNPSQAILKSREFTVRARNIMANSILPGAPAVSMTHLNDSLGSGRGERDWQAEIELPFWLPNQRSNRLKVAETAKSDLATSRESLKLQVAGYLRDALWDVAMNETNVTLALQRFETAKGLQHDVERRYQAGELAKTDAMFAQQETLIAEKAKLRADAELMHSRHRYYVLTGLREIPAEYKEPQSTLLDYSQSPLWLEYESKVHLAEDERNLIRVERRENPQVLFSTRSQRGAFDNTYNDSVGLKVRIPLDSEVRAAPLQAMAEVVVGNAMAERERLRLMLDTALHEAEHNLNVSRAELSIASHQFDIATESLRLARKAFKLGETDLVSLLRVQAQTYEAERAYNTRQIQLQWDIARYNQAVGVLP